MVAITEAVTILFIVTLRLGQKQTGVTLSYSVYRSGWFCCYQNRARGMRLDPAAYYVRGSFIFPGKPVLGESVLVPVT